MPTTLPSPSEHARFWSLDPQIVFLNHGSYGACPLSILQYQQKIRAQLEMEPLRFFLREWEQLLQRARAAAAGLVNAQETEIVFVTNATTGVNTILKSLRFNPGDEILITSHEYNACRNAVEAVCERSGAKAVVVPLPFPVGSSSQIIEAIFERMTRSTKLVLLDHVVSQSSLVMPMAAVIEECRRRGIEVLVDGAHAPGMIDLDLSSLAPDYYTANCHKWLCAPKGAAFLYVRKEHQAKIRPLVISHGANSPRTDKSRFLLEFDWTGTHDPSAYLSIPSALEFLNSSLPEGLGEVRATNRTLALQGQSILCNELGAVPAGPESMMGSMATVLLPEPLSKIEAQVLHDRLFDECGIEVQVMRSIYTTDSILRISAQLYNSVGQYEYLAECLKKMASSRK
jgi:isopenicillin-N epimerase